MHSSSSSLSDDLSSFLSPPLFSLLFAARQKKRYKQPRKSKWSTGVIKKTKKKKPPFPASSSSSSLSSSESGPEESGAVEMRAANGSSTASESRDGEQNQNRPTATMNGCHHDLNGVTDIQNGFFVNGYQHPEPLDLQPADRVLRPRTSKTPPNRKMTVNGVCLGQRGLYT